MRQLRLAGAEAFRARNRGFALKMGGRTMKIATFNLNGIHCRLPLLLAWLDETHPDLACLPEFAASDAGVSHPALAPLGHAMLRRGHDDSANDHAPVWVQAR